MNRKLYFAIGSGLLIAVLLLFASGACCNHGCEQTPSTDVSAAFGVITLPATNVRGTSATLNGLIIGGKATTWAFAYGTQSVQDNPGNVSPENAGYQFTKISKVGCYSGAFHADITGLTPGTRYYVRAGALSAATTAAWTMATGASPAATPASSGINWIYGGQVY